MPSDGYPLVAAHPRTRSTTVAELFRSEWTTSAAVYLPGGDPPKPGALFRNPALAATYAPHRRGSRSGRRRPRGADRARARDAWYRGFVAEAIDRFCRTHEVHGQSPAAAIAAC